MDARAQCALLADLSLEAWLGDEDQEIYELYIRPTKRTEHLVNRVFTCADTAECMIPENAADLQYSEIFQRADLARCSVMADIWFKARTDEDDPPLSDLTYNNLLPVLGDGSWSTGQKTTYVAQIDAILIAMGEDEVLATDVVDEFEDCSAALEKADIEVMDVYEEPYADTTSESSP